MARQKRQLDLTECAAAAKACACFSYRKASRAVTQVFDDVLQPSGLRSTQLVILLVVAVGKSSTVVQLANELVMDRSTLARNLKPLEKQGLVSVKPGADRRTRVVTLTASGRRALLKAIPLWKQAQSEFVASIGPQRWKELSGYLAATVESVRG